MLVLNIVSDFTQNSNAALADTRMLNNQRGPVSNTVHPSKGLYTGFLNTSFLHASSLPFDKGNRAFQPQTKEGNSNDAVYLTILRVG